MAGNARLAAQVNHCEENPEESCRSPSCGGRDLHGRATHSGGCMAAAARPDNGLQSIR